MRLTSRLKAALEGGVEGRPANVLFYATSNRRHLMPREMMENERGSAINPGEAVEEKVSLSDRFGLWLGFHHCSQDDYLAMVFGYAETLRACGSPGGDRIPGARVGDHARLALGPHRLAVHPGSGGTSGEAARRGRLTGSIRRLCLPKHRGRRACLWTRRPRWRQGSGCLAEIPNALSGNVQTEGWTSSTSPGVRARRDNWSGRPASNPSAARSGVAGR